MTAVLESAPQMKELPARSLELDRGELERRAYFHYLDRGCVDGYALEDWLAAEGELLRENSQDRGSPG